MSRKPNSALTSDSVKHFSADTVEARVLETAMRMVAGLTVDDADKAFLAGHPGTISALWLRFKQARTAFEAVDMLAQMQAASAPVAPVEPAVNGTVPADKTPANKA